MPEMFVNPLPQLRVAHLLQFDFPADKPEVRRKKYHANDCLPNINIEPPGVEEMYGMLGTPAREQGHPCICESPGPEPEDPHRFPHQDQVLDFDREIRIDHTGRLSGCFVKYLAQDEYRSKVRIFVHHLGPSAGPPIELATIDDTLEPGPDAPNSWFWLDPRARSELIYSAHTIVVPEKAGLEKENVYKLVSKWEFWDHSGQEPQRMPMSGFNEAVAFEVTSGSAIL
jgi:hypothetical protein